ncbi:MAG: alpha/beta hydrolase family protein [Erysipelotrichaceae bacterium]|nr:alpha/beta hydrolase family protein [Erysipelotrichaceae bacterium]
MATITVNFMSKSLMRNVTMNVILPVDKFSFTGETQPEATSFKTLYLLHGIFGDHNDWISGTSIKRFAEQRNLAVVMPSGENMAYLDQEAAQTMYGEFIGREMVEITRKMFPLSSKREDTFIGGLSMGGYGALRNGLKYSDTFSHIIGLSSAIMTDMLKGMSEVGSSPMFSRSYMETIFGDLDKVEGSDKNPLWTISKLKEQDAPLPKVFLACGTSDPLLPTNRKFKESLDNEGIENTYKEGAGAHEWDFWNRYIEKALDWLPLDSESNAGINSGNVMM